ncbi:MAG: IS1380 family transposase, partial [Deltaproteobacteria bacterium]|nr:IS1380 family transposase [Deltaproteobacteria bacterium]
MEQLPGRMVSVKKGWTYRTRGYAPLIVSLANTKEVLSLVNRPGNRPSHDGCVEWIEQAIKLVKPYARKVCVRGDTDYSLTTHFDRWSEDSDFVFGMDASAVLKGRAGALPEGAWKERKRKPKYTIKTWERDKPENEKERIVKGRGYKNIYLEREHVAEFDYRPVKCNNSYRVVALRKTLSVKEGQMKLYDDVRYFFYITTKRNI